MDNLSFLADETFQTLFMFILVVGLPLYWQLRSMRRLQEDAIEQSAIWKTKVESRLTDMETWRVRHEQDCEKRHNLLKQDLDNQYDRLEKLIEKGFAESKTARRSIYDKIEGNTAKIAALEARDT